VPVVVSNRGGIPKQVVEGESGFVLDFDKPDFDLDRGSTIISELLADDEKYARLVESTKHQAHTFNSREITTTANVTRFLRVFNKVMNGNAVPADRVWFVRDMDVEASL
jgi:glycosyltransferase involved in cell wall biosynthesis